MSAPALAADPALPASDRVLVSIDGDVNLPAGDSAGTIVVIQGDALIAGVARSVVVVAARRPSISTTLGARNGLLVKDRWRWSAPGSDTVIFDRPR